MVYSVFVFLPLPLKIGFVTLGPLSLDMAGRYEAGFDQILIHLLHCLISLKKLIFLKYNASLIS